MRHISFLVVPIRDYAFFEQAVFQGEVGHDFLQVTHLPAQVCDLAGSGLTLGIAGEPAPAGFKELLRPANGMDGSPSDPTG